MLIQESYNFFSSWLNPVLPQVDKDGNIYRTIWGGQSSNAYLRLLDQPQFSYHARNLANALYKTNPYAKALIDARANLIIGEGFEYIGKTPEVQQQLDTFIKNNKCFRKRVKLQQQLDIDGEQFIRIMDVGDPNTEIALISPQHINVKGDETKGVNYDPRDYEKVVEYNYQVSGFDDEILTPDEVQYRRRGFDNQLRGDSLLLPIFRNLINAQGINHGLSAVIDTINKFALIRQHKSGKDAVSTMRSDISYKPINPQQDQLYPTENIERYDDGSIHDSLKDSEYVFPGATIDANSFLSVLKSNLQAGSVVGKVPDYCITGDQSDMAAYSAALVAESPMVKAMEQEQREQIEWDLELFQMCGIDRDQIIINAPSVIVRDLQAEVIVNEYLYTKGAISAHTSARNFGYDYEAEQEILKTEKNDYKPMDELGIQASARSQLSALQKKPQAEIQ